MVFNYTLQAFKIKPKTNKYQRIDKTVIIIYNLIKESKDSFFSIKGNANSY